MPIVDLNITPSFLRPELLQHGQIPQPMAGVAPRTIMGQEWWDGVRKVAYATNNYCCWACGASDRLDAHEAYDIDYALGRMHFIEVAALCPDCHAFIHAGRTKLFVSETEFKRIVLHGHKILRKAKLQAHWSLRTVLSIANLWSIPVIANIQPPPSLYEHHWSKWRMVFENHEYPPKFKTSRAAQLFFEKQKGA